MVNNCTHRVETITATATNVVLTVSDSTNVSPYEKFNFYFPKFRNIRNVVIGAPLTVLINVNGVDVAVLDKNAQPLQSDRVPRRSLGRYIVPDGATPYVILYNTPYDVCN